jgi:hypothetical protein
MEFMRSALGPESEKIQRGSRYFRKVRTTDSCATATLFNYIVGAGDWLAIGNNHGIRRPRPKGCDELLNSLAYNTVMALVS